MKSETLPAQLPKRVGRQTILIVDDEWAMRDLLITILEVETLYRTFAVSDASQAVEVVEAIRPSLFILDYGLPGMDGLQLHDHLHTIRGLETIPTLMIGDVAPSRQARQDRLITFLTKPFDIDLLLAIINNLLARKHT